MDAPLYDPLILLKNQKTQNFYTFFGKYIRRIYFFTMKFRVRKAHDRGTANHGWLHANFSFSFANYYDPEWSGFHSLIVMNNDIIEPGGGFPTHPHRDAEIFTFVISGESGTSGQHGKWDGHQTRRTAVHECRFGSDSQRI